MLASRLETCALHEGSTTQRGVYKGPSTMQTLVSTVGFYTFLKTNRNYSIVLIGAFPDPRRPHTEKQIGFGGGFSFLPGLQCERSLGYEAALQTSEA